VTKSNSRLSLAAVGAVLALLHAAPAMGVTFAKTYVSGTGSDANNCSTILLACATFATALASTAPGGEITVVNTGNFGTVTINQSINITNDGAGEAGILTGGTAGIAISAGAGDIVGLRGLVIDGQGIGNIGISIVQASAVHIQNCVIRNVQALGPLTFGLILQHLTNTQLFVSDTIIFNNGSGATSGGIFIQPQAAVSANVVLDRVHLENNVVGLLVDGTASTGNGAHVVIRDSVVSGNASDGIRAHTTAGKAPAFLVVEHTTSVTNGGTGILANGPRATMLLDGNVVSRNGAGISAINGGQLISYGNNRVNNNLGADGVPTGSYSPI